MGNKLGWIIAGIGLTVVIVVILMLVVFPSPDKPTRDTRQAGTLDLQAPATPISKLGVNPLGGGNAGDDYAKAVEHYQRNDEDFKRIWQKLADSHKTTLNENELAMCNTLLLRMKPAMGKKEMRYTLVYTPSQLKISAFADGSDDLFRLWEVLECLRTHYERTNQTDKAIKLTQHELVLGWHMMNERARANMVQTGLTIQKHAAQILAENYRQKKDNAKAQAAQNYRDEIAGIDGEYTRKFRFVWTLKRRSDGKQGPNPGDIFNIIENDQDRAWRVEGLLMVGWLKFSEKSNRGNMRAIKNFWQQYSASDDPLLRAAAEISKTATKAQIETWAAGE
jgi:hypothetical protein